MPEFLFINPYPTTTGKDSALDLVVGKAKFNTALGRIKTTYKAAKSKSKTRHPNCGNIKYK